MTRATLKDVRDCIHDARTHVDLLVGRAVAIASAAGEDVEALARLAADLDTNLGGADSILREIEAKS